MKQVTLTTDGACLGNPGPGGWAFILECRAHCKEQSGACAETTTNNRMELQAAIEGLRSLKEPCEVLLISDSQYLLFRWYPPIMKCSGSHTDTVEHGVNPLLDQVQSVGHECNCFRKTFCRD
jgi:hypothetical protein